MRLSSDGRGFSALFDALMFFLIVSAACAVLFFGAASDTGGGGSSSAGAGRLAPDTLSCALDATVGPVDYSSGGQNRQFLGTALGAIIETLRVQSSNAECNTTGLEDCVRHVLGLLVDRPYHFLLIAQLDGRPGCVFISDAPGELSGMASGRQSCSVPLDVDGMSGGLELYMWR